MASSNTAKEVAAASGHRRVTIAAPYVGEHGRDRSPETDVKAVYDYFLRLDGEGPHFASARSWAHTRLERTVDPGFYFFLMMLLMVETTTEGGVRPITGRNEDILAYKRIVSLAARASLGLATGAQQSALKTLTYSDHYYDRRFYHDVTKAKEKLQREIAEKRNKKGGGKKVAAVAAQPPQQQEQPLDDNWAKDFQLYVRGSTTIMPSMPLETMYIVTTNKRRRVAAPAAPEQQHDEEAGEEAVAEEALEEEEEDTFGDGPTIVSKVLFTVTTVPRIGGDPEDPAGLMIRFIVRDPSLNPGRFFHKIVSNLSARMSRAKAPPQRGPGNGGGGEMFPNYGSFFHTQHPAGDGSSYQTYFNSVIKLCPELLNGDASRRQLGEQMNVIDMSSKFHLCNVMTTRKALLVMRDAGVPDEYCRDAKMWWDPVNRVAKYPDDLDTFKFRSEGVFWSSPTHIGFSEHFFPHVNMETDFISSLMGGRDLSGFLEGDYGGGEAAAAIVNQQRVLTIFEQIRNLVKDNWNVKRSDLLATNLVHYNTNNEFIHRAAEAALINKRVMQELPGHYLETLTEIQELSRLDPHGWRRRVVDDADLQRRIDECERYNEIRNKAQLACMKNFCALWQLEGNVDDLPIPYTIKAMLKWYRDNHATKMPNISRGFTLLDPNLGTFGNSMMRQVQMYARVARILQPIICMLAEGLFSCYQYSPQELCFNIMAHGRYDTGKTYAAITTLLRYTTIENTVKEYCVATKAADTSENHKYDLIIASDEVAPHKVSTKEAEKNPEQVNKEKIKMTRRQLGLEAFKFVKTPDGEEKRWTETITMDHYVALVEVTNAVVESMNPLASRYHRLTVAQSKVPAREMNGFLGETLKNTTVTYMQINQFLSAACYKASMCGGMLPSPDMQLFDDISNRVINYLVEQKAISAEVGSRNLEIMKPYARQLVIKHAIHCVFDMPSGVHYMKKFEAGMIRDLQPYLYCTVDIVWWCWSALASGWIDEHVSSVIKAAREVAGISKEWPDDAHPYEIYERDINNRITWRTVANPMGNNVEHKGDERMVDLRQVVIEASDMKALCIKIAAQTTNPKLDASDVNGVLNMLRIRNIDTPDFPSPQPAVTFAKWHKYQTEAGDMKMTDPAGNMMPPQYRQKNHDTSMNRTMEDIPASGFDSRCQAVEFGYTKGIQLYIMPHIASTFRSEKILHALWYATLCKTMRPGKILLGLPHDKDPTNLQVWQCSEEIIRSQIIEMDAADGWRLNLDTAELEWTKNPNIPMDERPVPRQTQGIAFNRRGGMSVPDMVPFTAVHIAPIQEGDTSWKSKIEDDISKMANVREISYDLDADSAKRQHMMCGRPLDEPIRTPTWIMEQYKKACRERGIPESSNMNYPYDSLVHGGERAAVWDATTSSAAVAKLSADHLRIQKRADLFMSPDTRRLAEDRATKDLMKLRQGQVAAQPPPVLAPPSFMPVSPMRQSVPPAQPRTAGMEPANKRSRAMIQANKR